MFNIGGSTFSAVRQWEEAGVLLFNSLENYEKLCASLGKESLAGGAPPTYVAARIDTALGSFHTTLGRRLAQSHSALAQTRNQLLVPMHSFPEEVLSEIFMHVVFAPLDQFSREGEAPYSMKACLSELYRALHTLLCVCTMWRNIALNRGTLWSIVTLRTVRWDHESILGRLLQQNMGVELYLLVHGGARTDSPILRNHAARFRSVTIVDAQPDLIQDILAAFTGWCQPESLRLSQLSLYNIDRSGRLIHSSRILLYYR
ncbi:unnamed protein product [Rhizoctonia solani]|uniref:F-box domain-containing protein n=1 Tax=Rhizoctonia solani TaxID=456999 RepID=A0A8H3AL35_9AGAM|nr:unnamed protein product [Rhizoctonia solani]